MDTFFLLLNNLIPLYVLIGLGWVAGRFFGVDIKSLGSLGIYIFMPIAVFGYILKLDFKPIYIALPVFVYGFMAILMLAWFRVAKRIYPDNRSSLLTMCACWGNMGYFGLPLIIALFPPEAVGIYMFMIVGCIFLEATLGYYIWQRGNLDMLQSIKSVLKFPSLYAVLIALALNIVGVEMSQNIHTYWEYCRGAYIVIGMMIIGGALSKVNRLTIAPRFMGLAFLGKFIIWPALAIVMIFLDREYIHLFDATVHKMFFVLAIVPPGANIAAFAASLNIRPEKAASTIFLGTFLALAIIPLMLMLFDWIMAVAP